MRTWLVVAAERREFDGILKRAGESRPLDWPTARFAREAQWKGDRWWFVANGPGPALVERMLDVPKPNVTGLISTGLCGALDPALHVGDIVVWRREANLFPSSRLPVHTGEIVSQDTVAATARAKRELREQSRAIAVEMEAAAVSRVAERWNLPFRCIRAVSDTADEDLPLDFNRYRDKQGRFSEARIALAGVARPFTALPKLMLLARNSRTAADKLGEFFAACEF